MDFPLAQLVKSLPAMQETRAQSLSLEEPLEKEMATSPPLPRPSILAWRIPWTEEPRRLQSTGLQSRTRLTDREHAGERPILTRSRPEKEGLLPAFSSKKANMLELYGHPFSDEESQTYTTKT